MKILKNFLIFITTISMLATLAACNSNEKDSSNEETTEITYNVDTSYDFWDVTLNISDKWECKETDNSCTIMCLEDYSFMLICLFNTTDSYDSYTEIYNSFSSNEDYQDISKLSEYKDYPLYTFSYTEKSSGDPYECYYFIKNEIIYFIGVPKSLGGKNSIIFENLNDIMIPIKTMLLTEEYTKKYQ